MKKFLKATIAGALILCLVICAAYGAVYGRAPEEIAESAAGISEAFHIATQLAAEAESVISSNTAGHIVLSDGGSYADIAGVSINGNIVTISHGGFYKISGNLSEGQLAVNTKDTVVLILSGVSIFNASDATINVTNAEHVLLYLADGTVNTITSGSEQEIVSAEENTETENISGAAIYVHDNLSIAGNGTLEVGGYINNGIATTNHLVILGGNISSTALNNGIKGKDSVTIQDGVVSILSGNDGIKSNNMVDTGCGVISIYGGEITIQSFCDGIQAASALNIFGGNINIISGGGADEGPTHTDFGGGFAPGGGGFMPDDGGFAPNDGDFMPPSNDTERSEEDKQRADSNFQNGSDRKNDRKHPDEMSGFDGVNLDDSGGIRKKNDENFRGHGGRMGGFGSGDDGLSELFGSSANQDEGSRKGLKSDGDLNISGGTISIDSADDCIHANGNIVISGGEMTLASGDDGIHADLSLTINDGNIDITQSYEGIESFRVYVNGGEILLHASDDGFNANGGGGFVGVAVSSALSQDIPLLEINGGTIYVNADGDGLDSNGDLIINGGNVIVDGPSNDANGALDSGTESGGSLIVGGGTVLAIGASGMAETFTEKSTQCSFRLILSSSAQAGANITISDEDGVVLLSHSSAKSFDSVVFSSPDLAIGCTYTVTVDDATYSVTLDSISSGNSNRSMGGMRGGMRGWNKFS